MSYTDIRRIRTGLTPVEAARAVADFAYTAAVMVSRATFGLCREIARNRRVHRTADALRGLDDKTLRDIGLNRSQIMTVATKCVDDKTRDPRIAHS